MAGGVRTAPSLPAQCPKCPVPCPMPHPRRPFEVGVTKALGFDCQLQPPAITHSWPRGCAPYGAAYTQIQGTSSAYVATSPPPSSAARALIRTHCCVRSVLSAGLCGILNASFRMLVAGVGFRITLFFLTKIFAIQLGGKACGGRVVCPNCAKLALMSATQEGGCGIQAV